MLEFIEERKQLTGQKPTASEMQQFIARGTALSAAERTFAAGPEARLVRSLNVGFTHLETFRELGRALKNGECRNVQPDRAGLGATNGQPRSDELRSRKESSVLKIVKALVAGGGGVTERTAMEEAFNRISGPARSTKVSTPPKPYLPVSSKD